MTEQMDMVLAGAAILGNTLALVWSAATLKAGTRAALDQLNRDFSRISEELGRVSDRLDQALERWDSLARREHDRISDHETRLRVLETREDT